MKKTITLLLFILMLTPAALAAETRYVRDVLEITARSGPGLQYKVLKTLRSGQPVEVVEETEDGWAKIVIGEDKFGWALVRFLDRDVPDSQKYRTLKARIGPLESQLKNLQEENDRLVRMNQEMADELEETRNNLEQTSAAFDSLQEESRNYLNLKKEFEETSTGLKQKTERISELEKELTHAYFTTSIKWFLAGAGILVAGMLIGGRSKRKRPGLR